MKVLVVEDTEDSRILLEDNLRVQGYEVISAENGVEALQQLRQSHVDLIVSDILMPEMDGFELCRAIKRDHELATIPFIFYTATYTDSRDENLALALGADRFVIKPQDPEKLINIIKEVLSETKFTDKKQVVAQTSNHELDEMHVDSLSRKLNKKILELEAQKEQLQVITDAMPVLIADVGADGCYRYVNKAYEEWHHISRDEIIGRHVRDVVGKDAYEVIQPNIDKVLHGKKVSYEARVPFKREERFIHAEYIPYGRADHLPSGFFALVSDITERKKIDDENYELHQRVAKHEQELREILDGMVDAVITINEAGLILTFNRTAEKMFGYLEAEVIGENVSLLMPEPDKSEHDKYLKHYLQTGEAHVIGLGRDVIAQQKDGTTFPMRLSVIEYLPDSDGTRRFIGTCIDISLQKQQEEQLRRHQKMDALGKLTGGIAHDYNNMLGVILGYTDLLEGALSDQPKLSKYIHEIHHAGDRGARLTKKLLAFSSKKTAVTEVSNINKLLQNEQLMLEKTLTARIQLELDLADDLWLVKLDNGDLEDAILNMSINAMHAINGSGQLIFQTGNVQIDEMDSQLLQLDAGDYVLLSITDTGSGMAEKTKEKIFDPFFSTKEDKGTGLGLSQVYGFVERSDGAIKVYSEPGHGTRFTLYFPRHFGSESENQQTVIESSNDFSGKETILIVDDEPSLLNLITEILEQQGYKVFCAHSGKEALEVLEHESIDLLISDVIMPEMDGYHLAVIVQEKYPSVKIQLASGFSDDRHVDMVDDSLHQHMLAKPYHSKNLLKRIRELLD